MYTCFLKTNEWFFKESFKNPIASCCYFEGIFDVIIVRISEQR